MKPSSRPTRALYGPVALASPQTQASTRTDALFSAILLLGWGIVLPSASSVESFGVFPQLSCAPRFIDTVEVTGTAFVYKIHRDGV